MILKSELKVLLKIIDLVKEYISPAFGLKGFTKIYSVSINSWNIIPS